MAHANKPPSQASDSLTVKPAVTSTVEREIKLAIDDNFRLPPLPGIPLTRRLLTSTYYDTSQYDLAQARITLRHRIERGKQAWQLKLPLLKNRQEVEIVDRQSRPPTTFRDLLFLHLGRRRLVPVVTLRVWRAGVRVCIDDTPVADVTLDYVTVLKNGAVLHRFRELEIEQVNGNDSTLADLEE
jgi:inorganic triphosphatase YgiF